MKLSSTLTEKLKHEMPFSPHFFFFFSVHPKLSTSHDWDRAKRNRHVPRFSFCLQHWLVLNTNGAVLTLERQVLASAWPSNCLSVQMLWKVYVGGKDWLKDAKNICLAYLKLNLKWRLQNTLQCQSEQPSASLAYINKMPLSIASMVLTINKLSAFCDDNEFTAVFVTNLCKRLSCIFVSIGKLDVFQTTVLRSATAPTSMQYSISSRDSASQQGPCKMFALSKFFNALPLCEIQPNTSFSCSMIWLMA